MKPTTSLLFVSMLLVSLAADAVTYIHPTIPGTDSDDPDQGGMAIDGDRIYPTISLSGAEDPSRTGYVRDGDEWVETWPMSTARKAHGRRYNVSGGDGRRVVPMPVSRRYEEDDSSRRDMDDIRMPCPPKMEELGNC
jgi:hypothetical protein